MNSHAMILNGPGLLTGPGPWNSYRSSVVVDQAAFSFFGQGISYLFAVTLKQCKGLRQSSFTFCLSVKTLTRHLFTPQKKVSSSPKKLFFFFKKKKNPLKATGLGGQASSSFERQILVMEEEKATIVSALPVQDNPKKRDGPEPVAGRTASLDENDPPATRKELYSYYAYYAGNNGIGSFQ